MCVHYATLPESEASFRNDKCEVFVCIQTEVSATFWVHKFSKPLPPFRSAKWSPFPIVEDIQIFYFEQGKALKYHYFEIKI